MKKILMINTVGYGQNGIVSVCANLCEGLDFHKYKVDLVSFYDIDEQIFKKFENTHTKLYVLPHRKTELKSYLVQLYKMMKVNHYDIVHVHGNSSTMIIESILARLCHIKNIVVHCHNNNTSHAFLNSCLKPFFKLSYTDAVACSHLAGQWLFGKSHYSIIKNGIHSHDFIFDTSARMEIRKKLNITDELVLGHVGLFNQQKNQEFLLKLIEQLVQKDISCRLLLLGDGELKEQLMKLTYEFNIQDYVIFLENTNDIPQFLSAMDVFVFPSKWEGFGLAILEAQANGLPCLVSNFVSDDVNITKDLIYISLDDLDLWIEKILSLDLSLRYQQSLGNIKKIREVNYDFENIVQDLEDLYNHSR